MWCSLVVLQTRAAVACPCRASGVQFARGAGQLHQEAASSYCSAEFVYPVVGCCVLLRSKQWAFSWCVLMYRSMMLKVFFVPTESSEPRISGKLKVELPHTLSELTHMLSS